MRQRSLLFTLLFLCTLWLSSCEERRGEVTLKIVSTTDIHGFFFPVDPISGENRVGCLAKVSTYLKGERHKNNNGVIYLDAGDILQGSPEVYYDATANYSESCFSAKMLDNLGCVASAFGNRDLEVGINSYERFFASSKHKVICANLIFENSEETYLPPYEIIEQKGVRVAVLGMTLPIEKYTVPADLIDGFDFLNIKQCAQKYIQIIKEKESPDIIVGLFHSGLQGGTDIEDLKENATLQVAKEVPGFDIIIYGHDHLSHIEKVANCDGDSVLLLNAGPYAEKVANAIVSIKFKDKNVVGKSITGELFDVSSLAPDENFLKQAEPFEDDVNSYMDSIIGRLDSPLYYKSSLWGPSSFMDYIHGIQLKIMSSEVSLATPSTCNSDFPAGPFSIRNSFLLYQYDNTIETYMFSGNEIDKILEYSASKWFNCIEDNPDYLLKVSMDSITNTLRFINPLTTFISAAGIDYVVDVSKPEGMRVNVIKMSNGKSFDPNKFYRVTTNSYLSNGKKAPIIESLGFSRAQMKKRLVISTRADFRFHVITDFSVKNEVNQSVSVIRHNNWEIVPKKKVEKYLSADTLNIISK